MVSLDIPRDRLEYAGDAIDVVVLLAKHLPADSVVMLAEVDTDPTARKHLGKHPDIQEFVPSALRMRDEYGVPFWMAVTLSASKHGGELPDAIFTAASFHQEVPSSSVETMNIGHLSRDLLLARGRALARGRMLMLLSQVLLADGFVLHLPMLDFRLPSSGNNLSTVRQMLVQLDMSGVVLNSGRSYHFYGCTLLQAEELRVFLAKALFFTPLIDHRWIAHQLVEGRCALRIIRNGEKDSTPTVETVV